MNINLDYIKQMRIQNWDAYFECYDLIKNIEMHGRPMERLRLSSLKDKLAKLAVKSKKHDEIYCLIHDPFYPIPS